MDKSYNETITRLEGILRELECEFLYLISDIHTDPARIEALADLSVSKLEIARHCLSVAAEALRAEPAELPGQH